MGKNKVLVKVHPEGKYVVDIDKNINMADVSARFPTLLLCKRNRPIVNVCADSR